MIQSSVSGSHDRVATDAPAPRAPHDLAADGQSDARAIGERCVPTAASKTPRLSWKIAPEYGPRGASVYEVEVHDSSNHRLWSSGIVASGLTEAVVGKELTSHSIYSWRVRVADRDLRWSEWATSALESGPFEYSDWQAKWLAVTHLAWIATPVRVVSPVVRARLYLTGQGVIRAFVNDTTVNPDRMDPTRTDFVRALYRSYDVTDLLHSGDNTLSFVAGLGEWARTGQSPRLLAELVMWHEDGSTSRIAPGSDSVPQASEVVTDQPFYLERHDSGAAASSVGAHPAPLALEAALLPASFATPPLDVSPDPTPPLRRVHTFAPTEIGRTDGSRTFDVGANIAGRSMITLRDGVPLGTVIQVLHGEHLDADGHIDTTNLTMPYDRGRERQLVEYVSTGVSDETHEPWFAYYGFRYLEVRGLPENAAVTVAAYSMHTDLVSSGSISTDSPTIDLLLAAAQRTLLNNVHGVPEDCPTREQAAWTGDTASVAEYELAAFESATFLDKWIADLETSQQPDGQLPAVAPDLHATRMPSDPVWGSALHRMLLGHLLHYGDTRLTRRALPTLRRWADFQLSCTDENGIVSGSPISYGHDWLALEQTPPTIHHTAAVIDCLLALAQLEEATGDVDAAARRRASAHDLRFAARRAFFDASTGAFGNGSQGSYAVAIESGILTGTEAQDAGERLVKLIRERGNRVSSGFATTRSVVRALTMLGKSQVVFDILRQPAEPGVGAMLVSGPGTFWECWWIDPTNTGTGSLNHVGLGGPFAAWAWEGLAGIRPTAPGYTRFRIAPRFVDGVTRLSLATNTVRGEVAISYTRTASVARLEVTVPSGSEGILAIPGRADALLGTGTHVIEVDVQNPIAWIPPEEAMPWSPPALASASADVFGSRTLLDESVLTPGRANPSLESLPRLVCMPIPHEQFGHPVVRVIAEADSTDDGAPTVMVTPRIPLRLDDVSFVYALVDQCVEGPERSATPFLRLHLSDGQTRSSSSIAWPAGWNRVAVDTGTIDAGVEVVAMEVGLDFADNLPADSLALYPREADIRSAFHLGEVGFSRSSRTW